VKTEERKRSYRGHVQAEVRALTRQRIIDATLSLYAEKWIDDITLDEVAGRAGVTVQTILRHFKTKDGLVDAAGQYSSGTEMTRRATASSGNISAVIEYIVNHYEHQGDLVLRGLAQEGRHSGIAKVMQHGREVHRSWVRKAFKPQLDRRSKSDRERLLAQLVAVLDVYTWKLLRRQAGLSRAATARAIRELVDGVIA
jgi:AcrR family transcriptional regulator